MTSAKKLRCAVCGKELDDGGYMSLDNWLQLHHYRTIGPSAEANCYCSLECFADGCMLTWMDAEDFEWGDDDDDGTD